MATTRVVSDRVKWYQVVLLLSQVEVRSRVQAATVDVAARLVMHSHGFTFVDSASIWLLGRSGAPTLRCGVRCRLPRVYHLAESEVRS
jgi:hypothetical protein